MLDFLLMLCSIGRHYPGFETDIHGAKRDEDGVYRVRVLKNDERLARLTARTSNVAGLTEGV
ncbi:Lysine decarboxylase 2, constitutive [Klebsiella pneumoniae]|uniref:Lysine decarboxylase 2, constitutive n=1 Tax=Klebsiella pneumoniae TaxID=573 RepID=A0A447S067_KLEPN|nr:Lysine decarboxylase 2, constitutive [Klebsiella pneumoniae]